jgi:hypothetical protein
MGKHMEQAGIPGIITCENKALTACFTKSRTPISVSPGQQFQ